MEDGLTDRLIQVGLRTINGHHRALDPAHVPGVTCREPGGLTPGK